MNLLFFIYIIHILNLQFFLAFSKDINNILFISLLLVCDSNILGLLRARCSQIIIHTRFFNETHNYTIYPLSSPLGSSAQLDTCLYNEIKKEFLNIYIHSVVQYPGIIAQCLSFWIAYPWFAFLFFLTKTPERSTHANRILL